MKQTKTRLLHLMGLITWGDIDHLTMYKNKRRQVVVFSKTRPEKPPSPLQTHYRTLFRAAIADWNNLPPGERAPWHVAVRRCSLPLTGFNLYLAFKLSPDPAGLATIERQSRTTLTL